MTLQIVHCSAVQKTWDIIVALPMIYLKTSAFLCFHRMGMILTYSANHLEIYCKKKYNRRAKYHSLCSPNFANTNSCKALCIWVQSNNISACVFAGSGSANGKQVDAFDHLNKVSDMLKYLAELWPKMWGKNFIFLKKNIKIIRSLSAMWKTHHWKY